MPQGKGTYGDQIGRPKKRSGFKMKYQSDSFPFKENSPFTSKSEDSQRMEASSQKMQDDPAWGDPEEYFQKDPMSNVMDTDMEKAMAEILKMTPKYK